MAPLVLILALSSLFSSLAEAVSLRRHKGKIDHVKTQVVWFTNQRAMSINRMMSVRQRFECARTFASSPLRRILAKLTRDTEKEGNRRIGISLPNFNFGCQGCFVPKGVIEEMEKGLNDFYKKEKDITAELEEAYQATLNCEDNINTRFNYYGCNYPESEYAVELMKHDLESVQSNCRYNKDPPSTYSPTATRPVYDPWAWSSFKFDWSGIDFSKFSTGLVEDDAKERRDMSRDNNDPLGGGGWGFNYDHIPNYDYTPYGSTDYTPDRSTYTVGIPCEHRLENRTSECSRNLEDISRWLKRILHDHETATNNIVNAEADLEAAKTCAASSWHCSGNSLLDEFKKYAEEVKEAITDFLKGILCATIEILLSVIGAVIDALLAYLSGGLTGTFAATPMGTVICGNPAGITRNQNKNVKFFSQAGEQSKAIFSQSGQQRLRNTIMKNSKLKNPQNPTKMDTFWQDTFTEKAGFTALTKSATVCEDMPFCKEYKSSLSLSLLQQNQLENRTANAMMVVTPKQAYDFLFMLVVQILGFLANHNCEACEDLKNTLKDAQKFHGEWASLIGWCIMRAAEAVCGQFGTVILEVVKQLAVCNLCKICPKSACSVKILITKQECKDESLLELEGSGGNHELVSRRLFANSTDDETTDDSHETIDDGLKFVDMNNVDAVEVVSITQARGMYRIGISTDKGQPRWGGGCHEYCKAFKFAGAVGVVEGIHGNDFWYDIDDAKGNPVPHHFKLYPEAPLHSSKKGHTPCCSSRMKTVALDKDKASLNMCRACACVPKICKPTMSISETDCYTRSGAESKTGNYGGGKHGHFKVDYHELPPVSNLAVEHIVAVDVVPFVDVAFLLLCATDMGAKTFETTPLPRIRASFSTKRIRASILKT